MVPSRSFTAPTMAPTPSRPVTAVPPAPPRRRPGVADARVVDQNVDGPEPFVYGSDHGPHALRVGNVEVHGDPPAAGGGGRRRPSLPAPPGGGRHGRGRGPPPRGGWGGRH